MKHIYLLMALAGLFLASCGARGGNHQESYREAGISWLGAQNSTMDCSWLEAFDGVQTATLAILWGSFGENNDCLKQFIKLPQRKIINIYLSNGSCERKGICTEKDGSDIQGILNHLIEVKDFLKDCNDCRVIITPGLEDNWDENEACHIYRLVNDALATHSIHFYEIWRNPNNYQLSDCYDGVELHHDTFPEDFEGQCAYSNDGEDLRVGNTIWNLPHTIEPTSIKQLASNELHDCIVYLWTADGNCLSTDTTAAPAPFARQCGNTDNSTIIELNNLIKELEKWEPLEKKSSTTYLATFPHSNGSTVTKPKLVKFVLSSLD